MRGDAFVVGAVDGHGIRTTNLATFSRGQLVSWMRPAKSTPTTAAKHECTCELVALMRYGCKCGHLEWERSQK